MQTGFPSQSQVHTAAHIVDAFIAAIPRVLACTAILVLILYIWWFATRFLIWLLNLFRLRDREMAYLELIPLAHTDKSPQAGRQLFTDLHGFAAVRSVMDRLLDRSMVFSAEVVGTRKSGVRYILCVPLELKDDFQRTIHSFDPDIRVRETDDYLNSVQSAGRVMEFGLKLRYYPLASNDASVDGDPATYLLAAFKNLRPDEMVAMQLILTPTIVRGVERIARRMLRNHEQLDTLGRRQGVSGTAILRGIRTALFSVADTVGEAYRGTSTYSSDIQTELSRHQAHVAEGIKPARTMGTLETELAHEISGKLNQPLFYTNIRVVVVGSSARKRGDELRRSLSVFGTSYQAIVKRKDIPFTVRYRKYLMVYRLPSAKKRSSILSTSEVASIYHVPSIQANDVVRTLSKTLPAPQNVRNRADNKDYDVIIGEGTYHGETVTIGLTAEERERHMFIVGGTGSGKSTLMKYALVQDIRNGKGVAVLDPHGELAQEILTYIPKERINDVIYFNPADYSYPIGLNLLEVPEGLSGDELLDTKDFIAETIVSILRKTFSDDGVGEHRVEYILRNAVLTALTVKDATLFTVYDILSDSKYRRRVVTKLEDGWLKNFWTNEFGQAGSFQQIKMMAGVTSKIGRYRASVSASRILSQPKSTIRFDEILDGKILICNLAKGLIGEDTSEVLGIAILAELQLAAYRRIKQKQTDRRPFYVYVDEFQNFATPSFVEMLSEARKYKLLLTMAEQTTAQQDDSRMVNTILANAGTILCFKTNSKADEEQMLHLFEPYLGKGQLKNLPAFTFYAKLSGGLQPQEPLSGRTILLDKPERRDVAKGIIQASRENYSRKYKVPEIKVKKPRSKKSSSKGVTIRSVKDVT